MSGFATGVVLDHDEHVDIEQHEVSPGTSPKNDYQGEYVPKLKSQPSMLDLVMDRVFRGGASVEDLNEMDDKKSNVRKRTPSMEFESIPTWEPDRPFDFAVKDIRPKVAGSKDLTLDMFQDIHHLAKGSNADVSLAKLHGETIVIKMIQEVVEDDTVAQHEFDVEHGLLARIDHPNIVKILGSGKIPRKFLVLQYLSGGSMKQKFDASKQAKGGLSGMFNSKKTFTFPETLCIARELADALHYLHTEVHPDAILVHRDLKPDNIAFLADGRAMLFDLGLCTLVKRPGSVDTTYAMTGGTGSLRYMAPEVALDQPYNEKVDLYSFGVILWQMATDKVPYEGASRASYLRYACKLGDRPDMVASWPKEFKALLEACWHQDPVKRPSFAAVMKTLDGLIASNPVKK